MSSPKNTRPLIELRSDAKDWFSDTLERLGYQAVAKLEVVNDDYLSDVWSIKTQKGKVFFKATAPMPLFCNEAKLSQALTQLFPGLTADVIAIEEERCWQLTTDFGKTVGRNKDATTLESSDIYHLWGSLQRQSVDHVDRLLASGCRRRPIDKLAEQFFSYIERADIAAAFVAKGVVWDSSLRAKLENAVQELIASSTVTCMTTTLPGLVIRTYFLIGAMPAFLTRLWRGISCIDCPNLQKKKHCLAVTSYAVPGI